MESALSIDTLLIILEMIGTVAFAFSGVLTAKETNMDVFGALVLGVVTAVGGGMLRDILLGNLPPAALMWPGYLLLSLGASVFLILVEYCLQPVVQRHRLATDTFLNITDSLGLAAFAVIGVQGAIESAYHSGYLAVFVGVITAVGGGMLRDILASKMPVVMRKRVYALAALIGSVVYYLLQKQKALGDTLPALLSIALMLLIRFLAIHYKWNLPKMPANPQQGSIGEGNRKK
jgi:uncharacterized membrane protein YeiH